VEVEEDEEEEDCDVVDDEEENNEQKQKWEQERGKGTILSNIAGMSDGNHAGKKKSCSEAGEIFPDLVDLRGVTNTGEQGKDKDMNAKITVAKTGTTLEREIMGGSDNEPLSHKMFQFRSHRGEGDTHSNFRIQRTYHNIFSAQRGHVQCNQCSFHIDSVEASMPFTGHSGRSGDAPTQRIDMPHGFGSTLEAYTCRLQRRLLEHAAEAETFSVPPRRVPQRLEKRAYSTLRGFARSGNGCIAGAIAGFRRASDVH